MLSDEAIEKVSERLVSRIEETNTYILKTMGESIKKIGTLTPSQARQLQQTLRYGGNYDKITQQLAKITKLNVKDIQDIFEEVARIDSEFAKQFYDYRNIKFVPFDENTALKQQVNALAKITAEEYVNISNTTAIGYLIKDSKDNLIFENIGDTYRNLVDRAVMSIAQGKNTFDSEMSRMIKEIGASGLKTVLYESGRTMRLDSAVRMNVRGALRDLHNEMQEQFGKEFNSDGVEVSVHLYPAPDHQFVQGHQFSNIEFNKFQNDEDAIDYQGNEFPAISEETGHDRRSISQYNCYHTIFSIVLGISKPRYNEEQLQEIIDENNNGFEFEGKHYTMYEGTQLQRRIETEIRKTKDIQIMAKASYNEAENQEEIKTIIDESQQKITQLTQKYKDLCNTSGLPTYMEKMRVSSYRRINTNKL